MENRKIRVAITHGDTNGIGYEIILKAFEKLDAYRELSKDKRTLHLVMVTTNGVAHNSYYNMVQKEINMDDQPHQRFA